MKKNPFIIIITLFTGIGCASIQQISQSRHLEDKTAAIPMEEKTVSINGKNIHYLVTGSGDPVVLVHGWVCWGGHWDKTFPALREKYTVYAPDLIGHGLSARPDDEMEYTTDRQAEMIVGFIKKVIGRPVYLVGHSMGGEISAKVALAAPELVRKLVLVNAVGLKKNPDILPVTVKIIRSLGLYRTVAALSCETNVRLMCRMYIYYKANPLEKRTIKAMMCYTFGTKETRKAFVKVCRKGLFYDFIDEKVPGIQVPTLLIWGREDEASPVAMGYRYNKLIPGSRLVIIPEAGHMVFEEKTEKFNMELCSFLSESI